MISHRNRLAILFSFTLLLFGLNACVGRGLYSENDYLRKAEELSRQKRYDEAIEAYQKHITYRLSLPKRAEWENPYFYLLLIGDIQMSQGKVEDALRSYESAEMNAVHPSLVSDRYRFVASWYEQDGKLEEAVAVLNKYRDRDQLLFDSMLDRISKEIVRREEGLPPTQVPVPTATATRAPYFAPRPSFSGDSSL